MKRLFLICGLIIAASAVRGESVCIGTTANGRLQGGVELPGTGNNFVSYSKVGQLLGRTFVHSRVREIVLDAYRQLESETPGKVYKYAETGFERGGRFWPHKTHQNGLSVDFMVPVMNEAGQSAHLPTHALNKFGYAIEFDNRGNYDKYHIDFDAMAAHLAALHRNAVRKGVDIWRVIFDPELQSYLFETEPGSYLKRHIRFSTKRAWVRHDEHYHVDFAIPCRKQH